MTVRIRPLIEDDLVEISRLNDEAYPAVPITSRGDLEMLVGIASLAVVAADDAEPGIPLGFVIALPPGCDYESENYAFFESRDVNHLYVDRIVVSESARSRGIGAVLYEAVFDRARADGRLEVTCEVNVDPPNPGSLRFHARLGFAELARQPTKGGSVTVALLSAPV